jgi:ribosomal protein S18 acetylase RimI-like enzyme
VAPSDLDLICHHRESMFRDMGSPDETLAAMRGPFREWLVSHLADGSYFGFIAEEGSAPVAGVGLMAIDWPPNLRDPHASRRGYVLNMYVEPSHRRQGLARKLMERAEEEFRARGIGYAILHASESGRPLYESTGWAQTNEMGKKL